MACPERPDRGADAIEEESIELRRRVAAIMLCGYLRGLWSRYGETPDQAMVAALRNLGVPEEFLPESDEVVP
ncbi:MAG: iron-containing alcohol dehydrogenase [Bdellovibrionaceae bacterium]|nr:iron-containing alcohol dehydrogenase [Pseudobdellovibrionaceae bacterium]